MHCTLAYPNFLPFNYPLHAPFPPLAPQASIHSSAKAAIQASALVPDGGRGREVNMVAEMVAYGDSGAYLDKVRHTLCALRPAGACCVTWWLS
jgi:hypothetical protein